jgi:hypothetical protein
MVSQRSWVRSFRMVTLVGQRTQTHLHPNVTTVVSNERQVETIEIEKRMVKTGSCGLQIGDQPKEEGGFFSGCSTQIN